MGKQHLDKHGQPIIVSDRDCPHGVHGDDRGNNACELCLEHGRTGSYLIGICAGWDQAHELYSKRASEAYAAGQDEKAKLLRELATEAKATSEARRKDYDRHKAEHGES